MYSVYYNNQCITRSIAKTMKENLEQIGDNQAKSISKMHNNNLINKILKPTKPKSDKLSNMPKTFNFCKINNDNCPLKGKYLIKM